MKLQRYKTKLRRWLISRLFSDYQKALIYEALIETSWRKNESMGETLHEQAADLREIYNQFISPIDLYK